MEVVKGEKCVGEVIIGFPGSGFRTVLEALPSDEVEDSTSDTPVGLAVDYVETSHCCSLSMMIGGGRSGCCPGYTSVTAGSKRET